MTNFQIHFTYPWLLLLLIPALALALFPYFRMAKKYRRTRNRVTSVILHILVMVLSIFALSGIYFTYNVTNTQNQVILLVDASYSGKDTEQNKNSFIQLVAEEGTSACQIGVVTFGYNQVYAVELTDDFDEIYDLYLNAESPDDSATDISSALQYASTLFDENAAKKIVLISDGLETDGTAVSAVRSLAADGITVDTVYFAENSVESEVEIVSVELPDYNVTIGDSFDISVTLKSYADSSSEATITLYQIDETGVETQGNSVDVTLISGTQTTTVSHSFSTPGLYKLRFAVSFSGDEVEQNNIYYSYLNVQTYDDILIIAQSNDEANALKTVLNEGNYSSVNVVAITDANNLPSTVNEMLRYDEIILMNIANADMPEGFVEMLYDYVYNYGGGLLTVGGNTTNAEGETVANMYSRSDLYGTLYQDMLPVQAVDYTPPMGVVFLVDASPSMVSNNLLEYAKSAAISSLGALSDRDYVGVVSFADTYVENIAMTAMTKQSDIITAISNIEAIEASGTTFAQAIQYASRLLYNCSTVQDRHIVIVTDGYWGDSDNALAQIQTAYDSYGITLSIVQIGTKTDAMREAAEDYGHGNYFNISQSEADTLASLLAEDLSTPEINEMIYEEFTPTIAVASSSVVNGVSQSAMPTLSGYYGTKIKDNATAILTGAYDVPIYAQWKYGAGTVGSFMCDLEGIWSADFMSNGTGKTLIYNIVSALLPTTDIEPQDIEVTVREDNYTTSLSIYADIDESAGETVEVTVTNVTKTAGTSVSIDMSESSGYSRASFEITEAGVYEIYVAKYASDGSLIAETTIYKAFSYSAEYDCFTEEDGREAMATLASYGGGETLTTASAVFDSFNVRQNRTYDPRLILLITALVLFLLDVAVRKFKFKWPHEIIRDRRQKKEYENK